MGRESMGYAHGQSLVKMGLTNKDQEDFGNIQLSTRIPPVDKAWCTSVWCTLREKRVHVDRRGRTYEVIPERVQKDTISRTCPDCKASIFWSSK